MNETHGSLQSLDRLRQHAIASLIPFFAAGEHERPEAARLMAEALLNDYGALTPKELQHATEIIALGLASMACLRAAVAAKNLPVTEVLRLQDDAIALDRSAQKSTACFTARMKDRVQSPGAIPIENRRWDEGTFQLAMNRALDRMTDADALLAVYTSTFAETEGQVVSLFPNGGQPKRAARGRRSAR